MLPGWRGLRRNVATTAPSRTAMAALWVEGTETGARSSTLGSPERRLAGRHRRLVAFHGHDKAGEAAAEAFARGLEYGLLPEPRGALAHPWPWCARLAQHRPQGGRTHTHGHHGDAIAAFAWPGRITRALHAATPRSRLGY